MFPISDSIKTSRFPYLNIFLVVTTVYVFIQEIIAPDTTSYIYQFGLIPKSVNLADISTLTPFVTAIFLHGGFLHILSNMWFLYIFGDNVETSLSPLAFLLLYLAGGIAGNIIQYAIMPASSIPMIGASGAVAAILGCYYVLFPHAKVRTIIFIFFFVTIVEISATFMLGYWFVLQLFSGVATLPGAGDQGGIAFFAHAAGFITGIIFGHVYKRRVP